MKNTLNPSVAIRFRHLAKSRMLTLRYLAALWSLILAVPMAHAGVALKLFYDGGGAGIPGNYVTNFTTDPSFPNSPDTGYSEVLTNGLTIAQTGIINYGSWTRGFIEAPQTGQYTFWVASDDEGQLWLSTDETPADLVQIAENLTAVGYGSYSSANQSAPISLVAGHKYYFEMRHKQGGGADHCEVAWLMPDGTYENVLSANHLWPYPVDRTNPSYPPVSLAPTILTDYLDSNAGTDPTVASLPATTSVLNGRAVDFAITAEASQPATVFWFSNSVLVANANLLTYHIPRVGLAQNGDVYSVTVSNSLGMSSPASTTISVAPDTTPPTLLDGLILGNPAGDISAVFSEGIDPVTGTNPANYSLDNGATVTSAVIGPDNATVLLRVSGLSLGTHYTLTVNNVQDLAGNAIAANSSVAVEANLNTAYGFDEISGTVANDASGNANNGTLVNGVQQGFTGKVLRSYKFDGVGGHVALPSGYSDFTSGMTVTLWASPSSSLTSWARFMDLGNGPSADNIIFARNGVSSDLTFEVRLGANTAGQITAPGVLSLNQWQHFAATMDASGNVTIYKNGVVVQTGTLTGVPNVVTRTNCYVARSDWVQDGYYQGKLDDFRIYNRVLTPDAIMALASGGGPDDSAVVPEAKVVATTPLTQEKTSNPGVFNITRTGSTSNPLTLQYVVSGTATNGMNYTSLPGTVTIAAGATNAQIVVQPINFSFQDISRTVVLTLTTSTNYTLADENADTVTIQNNDVVPVAYVATADNANGVKQLNTTIDVWFDAAVALPSATNLANYTLSGGLTVTSVALDTNHNLRVILGVSGPVPPNTTLGVTGVMDAGGNTAATNILVRLGLPSYDVVAHVYHQIRRFGFSSTSDGIVNNSNNGANGGTGFDTWPGNGSTQFGGMIYQSPVDIQTIKVDLGQQFSDGGDWQAQPNVYILKHPVDTDTTEPETDTNDWLKVPATLISGSTPTVVSGALSNPSPNTPYVYNLSALTLAQRSGYGWAVGGVKAAGANDFLSFSELRAYGVAATNYPATQFAQQPTNMTVAAGQRALFSAQVGMTNLMTPIVLGADNSTAPIYSYQWYLNGTPIAGATDGNYTTDQTTPGENENQYYVVATNNFFAITSSVVTLTVNARTTPPQVVAATIDLFGNIDVWFDEPVDPGTSQNTGNYTLNDPALTFTGIGQDSYQKRIALTYSGTQSISNVMLTVSGVMDTFGNTMGSQTVALQPQDWPVENLVANVYQQGRSAMLSTLTDGQVVIATATTAGAGDAGLTQFAGLIYNQPQVFGVVKVDLGNQFVDGGDWAFQPKVYILKSPIDSNQSRPELTPVVNGQPAWVEVPATLVSGNAYSWGIDGPVGNLEVNNPTAFDLSHLPLTERTGYGWAVGGVRANALGSVYTGIAPAAEFLSLSELRGFGMTPDTITGAPQVLNDIPAAMSYPQGLSLTLSVLVGGTQPITYQWTCNGTNLIDNGRIGGSQTSALTISEILASDAGSYQLLMTNAVGSNASTACALGVSRLGISNGIGWVQNGNGGNLNNFGGISGNALTLTDGSTGEARSDWLNTPQFIGAFTASYTYQDVGGGGADGMAFVLQNSAAGTSALGGGGGGLGYSGITPSAAVEFNIYSGNTNGYAFRTNGVTGIPYNRTGVLRVDSGDPIGVMLDYDGTTLSMTLTDAVAGVSFATNFVVDLSSIVGTNSAYVGFTGASGGIASKQQISNFTFASIPLLDIQSTATNSFLFSWPQAAGGFVLQQNADLTSTNWRTVDAGLVLTNGQNQTTVPMGTGGKFYRLALP